MPFAWNPLQLLYGALGGLPREPEPAPDPHVIWVICTGALDWQSVGPFPDRRAADLFRAAHLGRCSVVIEPLIAPSRWRGE